MVRAARVFISVPELYLLISDSGNAGDAAKVGEDHQNFAGWWYSHPGVDRNVGEDRYRFIEIDRIWTYQTYSHVAELKLAGWWFGTWLDYDFPVSWEWNNHPN